MSVYSGKCDLADHFWMRADTEEDILTSIDLRIALDKLSEEERELILLRYINEVPLSEMSKLYKISRFALYRRIQDITKKLQGYMGKE